MKLNEQCLVHIAQSSENPIDHSGWLFKLSNDQKQFQKKWFVLKENFLFYYNSKSEKEPNGLIILEGYRVEIIDTFTDRYAFKIDFGISRFGAKMKSYILAADSQSDMERWIKALSCASYDYLKMVVLELQHRLDEIKSIDSLDKQIEQNCHSTKSLDSFEIGMREKYSLSFRELHELYGKQIGERLVGLQQTNKNCIIPNNLKD
ncbi:PH domain-containing protein 5 [Sarcoptes scabiei]|nr:PH domain-containing protein 5 [Sarcoptes scabiei]